MEDQVHMLEEENNDLKWDNSAISSENDRLTANLLEMSIYSSIVTNAEVSGGLLNLDMFYVTRLFIRETARDHDFEFEGW